MGSGRLCLWVELHDGEDLSSVLDRWAARFGVPGRWLNARLGLAPGDGGVFGVTLTDLQRRTLARNLRRTEDAVEATVLSTLCANGVLALSDIRERGRKGVGADAGREWVTFTSTSACPFCVDEFGFWRLSWRLSTSFVCPIHGSVLAGACSGCGLRFRGRSTRTGPRASSLVPTIRRCMNTVDRRVCGTPIAATSTRSATATEIAAQRAIDSVAADGVGKLFGEQVSGSEWFQGLRLVASLLRRVGPPTSHDHAALAHRTLHPAATTRKPASPDDAAQLLPSAVEILRDASTDRLVELVDRSIRLDRDKSYRPWRPPAHAISADLDQLWADRLLLASKRPFGVRNSRRSVAVDARRLPGTLPQKQLAEFGDLLNSIHTDRSAVFAAALVARVGADLSWADAWNALGYPPEFCESWTRTIGPRRLGIADQLTAVAAELATSVDLWLTADFGHRRAALHNFDVDDDQWDRLARRHGLTPSGRQRHAATMWVHQALTGNHFVFSPRARALLEQGLTVRQIRKSFAGMAKVIAERPLLEGELVQAGLDFIDSSNAMRTTTDGKGKTECDDRRNSIYESELASL